MKRLVDVTGGKSQGLQAYLKLPLLSLFHRNQQALVDAQDDFALFEAIRLDLIT